MRWNGIPKPEDGRRNQSLSELDVIWIETMDSYKGDAAEDVIFDRDAVIDIHEFARYEPSCHAPRGHPGMSQSQEITIEASQAVDMRSRDSESYVSQAMLFGAGQMMMPDVRGIANDDIEF